MTNLLDLHSFVQRFEAATKQAGFKVVKRDGTILQVIVHGEPLQCNLEPIYRVYQNAPDRMKDIIESHLQALRAVPPHSATLTEKEAAESLLPMLQQAKWLEAQKQRAAPIPHRPFPGGLVITYVFDFPDYRAYVNEALMARMLETPTSSLEMIHQYALENLRRRTNSRSYETYGRRDKTLIVCETNDGYAATRVLLPDLMSRWDRRIPGRMLIGVPNRDFLIAFSDRDPDHVTAIARQIRRDAGRRDHPLSSDLLLWQRAQAASGTGKVVEYRPKQ